MRKLTTTVVFALLIATSAVAAPNDSSDRRTPNPITRIVRQIMHILDLGQPVPPTPEVPMTTTP